MWYVLFIEIIIVKISDVWRNSEDDPRPATSTFANLRRGPSAGLFLFGSKGFNQAIRLSEAGRPSETGL